MKNNYACIASRIGNKVYDYHSGFLRGKEPQKFLDHLSICPKCKETLRRLQWITRTILEQPNDFFNREVAGRLKVKTGKSTGNSPRVGARVVIDDRRNRPWLSEGTSLLNESLMRPESDRLGLHRMVERAVGGYIAKRIVERHTAIQKRTALRDHGLPGENTLPKK